jgi:DNA-binding CsgD family transcriptional regulator
MGHGLKANIPRGSTSVTRSRDVALIRRLCGLQLPGETLAQSLLPALRRLVPSHSGGVFWVDDNGEITNLYAERLLPPAVMADYYERHHRRASEGFASAFKRRVNDADPVSTRSFSRGEQSSEYFSEVMRKLDAYHILYAVLRAGARPYGQLSLYRGRTDAPYTKKDVEALRSVLHYVSAGLGRQLREDASDAEAESTVVEEHLGVVAHDGSLVSAPESWVVALRLAAAPEVSPRSASHEPADLEAFLNAIWVRMHNGARGQLQFEHRNMRGRFAIHAFRLPDIGGARPDQLGVLIRREEPKTVTLLRGLSGSELSPQQREVALLLAQGLSNREIAEKLGLSLNTAHYHVKQVYARLQVNAREDVGKKLMHSKP